jgi:hypothetical protein
MKLQEYIEPVQETIDDVLDDLPPEKVAKGLGFVSLAIGLTEIVAPHQIQKTMGIGNGQNTGVMRVLGLREIMHGVDLLSHDDPAPGVWARCAGDMLDGVVLAAAGMKSKKPGGFMAILALVAPVVILDHVLAPKLSARKSRPILSRLFGG